MVIDKATKAPIPVFFALAYDCRASSTHAAEVVIVRLMRMVEYPDLAHGCIAFTTCSSCRRVRCAPLPQVRPTLRVEYQDRITKSEVPHPGERVGQHALEGGRFYARAC